MGSQGSWSRRRQTRMKDSLVFGEKIDIRRSARPGSTNWLALSVLHDTKMIIPLSETNLSKFATLLVLINIIILLISVITRLCE